MKTYSITVDMYQILPLLETVSREIGIDERFLTILIFEKHLGCIYEGLVKGTELRKLKFRSEADALMFKLKYL